MACVTPLFVWVASSEIMQGGRRQRPKQASKPRSSDLLMLQVQIFKTPHTRDLSFVQKTLFNFIQQIYKSGTKTHLTKQRHELPFLYQLKSHGSIFAISSKSYEILQVTRKSTHFFIQRGCGPPC